MKKQFLTIAFLLMTLVFANNVYAAQNGSGSANNQGQQQTQVINQGTATQIQNSNASQDDSSNGIKIQQ